MRNIDRPLRQLSDSLTGDICILSGGGETVNLRLGGLRSKVVMDQYDEYLNHALRLTTNYVSTRSIALVIRDRAGNASTGTSICIEVGSHLLLATAGHVIADMNDDRLQLIPAGELSMLPVPFAGRSCSP